MAVYISVNSMNKMNNMVQRVDFVQISPGLCCRTLISV